MYDRRGTWKRDFLPSKELDDDAKLDDHVLNRKPTDATTVSGQPDYEPNFLNEDSSSVEMVLSRPTLKTEPLVPLVEAVPEPSYNLPEPQLLNKSQKPPLPI